MPWVSEAAQAVGAITWPLLTSRVSPDRCGGWTVGDTSKASQPLNPGTEGGGGGSHPES